MPAIMDILLRFRAWRNGLIADVEKVFHQVAIDETQRDYLRFLWLKDIETDNPELLVLRFCRVIFGVNASPFLLNGTIKHHIEKYFHDDSEMANKLLNALYVDDLSTGDNSVDNCFDLYQKSKDCFDSASFYLRKWASNSSELMSMIKNEQAAKDKLKEDPMSENGVFEHEQTFAKLSVSGLEEQNGSTDSKQVKVLGMKWDCETDNLHFDFESLVEFGYSLKPTKRNLLRLTTKIFDLLGILSPATFILKV